jgi:hypothetical protein
MTSPALLKSYRKVRDVVGDIHESAAAVDEHLGRFQIYGVAEDIGHAMAEAESLFAKIERLEIELRRCTSAPDRVGNINNQRAASP